MKTLARPLPLFTDETTREQFLENLNETTIFEPGTALSHVSVIKIGLWADERAICEDVARILAIELREFIKKEGFEDTPEWFLAPEAIASSTELRREVRKALAPARAKLDRELELRHGPTADKIPTYTVPEGAAIEHLYREIISETMVEHKINARCRMDEIRSLRESLDDIGIGTRDIG